MATKDMACGYPSATRRQSTWWRPASAAGLIDTSVAPYAPCVLCALSLFMFPPACSEEIKRQDLAPVARPSLQLGVLGVLGVRGTRPRMTHGLRRLWTAALQRSFRTPRSAW